MFSKKKSNDNLDKIAQFTEVMAKSTISYYKLKDASGIEATVIHLVNALAIFSRDESDMNIGIGNFQAILSQSEHAEELSKVHSLLQLRLGSVSPTYIPEMRDAHQSEMQSWLDSIDDEFWVRRMIKKNHPEVKSSEITKQLYEDYKK